MAENKRVVFDLNGTLIDRHKEWRSGAKGLLAKLQEKEIAPVVWTNVEKRGADPVIDGLESFHDLVKLTVTLDTSGDLLTKLSQKMLSSNDPVQIKRAERMKLLYMPKIPAAVDCNILVDDQPDLREMAKMLGAIAIDPTPADGDTSPEQWTERVLASILANFPE